jgi:hypothetical protein
MSETTEKTEESCIKIINKYGGSVYCDIKYISFRYEPNDEVKEAIEQLINKYNYDINRNVGSL